MGPKVLKSGSTGTSSGTDGPAAAAEAARQNRATRIVVHKLCTIWLTSSQQSVAKRMTESQ